MLDARLGQAACRAIPQRGLPNVAMTPFVANVQNVPAVRCEGWLSMIAGARSNLLQMTAVTIRDTDLPLIVTVTLEDDSPSVAGPLWKTTLHIYRGYAVCPASTRRQGPDIPLQIEGQLPVSGGHRYGHVRPLSDRDIDRDMGHGNRRSGNLGRGNLGRGTLLHRGRTIRWHRRQQHGERADRQGGGAQALAAIDDLHCLISGSRAKLCRRCGLRRRDSQ